MSEETTVTSETPAPMSVGTKCFYGFIALMWLAAGAAVYVTFFSNEARQRNQTADEVVPDIQPAQVDEEGKTIVFNSQGEVVNPKTEDELPRQLEPFTLTNQSNETIGLEQLKGKPWVGTFVFSSCPGPCSMITGRMKKLQQDMDDVDFNLVSITVDPKNDDPEKLTKYADAFTADLNNWHFLTGDMHVIYHLIKSGFKMPVKEMKPGDILHTNRFVVVDQDGQYVDSFTALEDEQYAGLKKRVRGLSEQSTPKESTPDSTTDTTTDEESTEQVSDEQES